ncbi:MAG: 30S ribosomal protein S8e [Methanosarcinales archaeon]|nr:MAG: 30S ribosomal protein S8e [Methanosarcinales archaeon]
MKWQGKSTRKMTGGRLISSRGKMKHELGREATQPHLGDVRQIDVRVRGGAKKVRLFQCDVANVTDPKTGKTKATKIETVEENPADQHYVRRNILTKGAIVKTALGKARITSRPGQDGIVNAVLVE